MNKNELEAEFTRCLPNGLVCEILDKFFDTNVCVPKGNNRHPDADILHALVENINARYEVRMNGETEFVYDDNFNQSIFEYRIMQPKPTAPIYEWQWKFKHPDSNATWDGYTMYATDAQFETIKMEWMKYEKDEETKRERQ